MHSLWLLLPALAGCLSPADSDRNFMKACKSLELSADGGDLCGDCEPNTRDASGSCVDLNECLAWGPGDGLRHAKEGHFTDNCNSCVLIGPGQSPSQVGHILCKCAPKGSEFRLEYTFDLTGIVSVTDDGSLQCLVAEAAEPEGLNGKRAREDHNDLASVFDWASWVAELDNTTCEESITWLIEDAPKYLPETYQNTSFESCPHDRSLCCFKTPEGRGYAMEGFKIIKVADYIYRLHFMAEPRSKHAMHFNHLSMIFRLCVDPDNCPEGATEPPSDMPTTTSTGTPSGAHNVLFPRSAPTTSNHDGGMLTIAANKKIERTPSTSTMSLVVTELTERLLPTPPSAGYGNEQKPMVPHAPEISVLSSRATPPEYDYKPLYVLVPPLPSKPNTTKPEVVIDLDQLDVSGLVDIMLDATNIEEVHRAEIDMKVKAICESNHGATGCSDMVIEMSGTPLSNKKNIQETRALAARALPFKTGTTTSAKKAKSKTQSKTKSKATKTKTKKVTVTRTGQPSTATITLTSTVSLNHTTSWSWTFPPTTSSSRTPGPIKLPVPTSTAILAETTSTEPPPVSINAASRRLRRGWF